MQLGLALHSLAPHIPHKRHGAGRGLLLLNKILSSARDEKPSKSAIASPFPELPNPVGDRGLLPSGLEPASICELWNILECTTCGDRTLQHIAGSA